MATATELLAAIDTAILDVLQNGQHITAEGQAYTKADLLTLQKMRSEYVTTAATSRSGGIFDRMKTGGPYRGA